MKIIVDCKHKVGGWILESDADEPNPMFKLVVCSRCKEKANDTYGYCPNCGAEMKYYRGSNHKSVVKVKRSKTY